MSVDPRSVLLVTLDSCRFDTFEASAAPNIRRIGPLHRAHAPSHFTLGSHAAIFAGFTPGVGSERVPYVNPKFAKIFKLSGGGSPGFAHTPFSLEGRNIIDGLRRQGYLTIGTGAVGWFNPETPAAQVLVDQFDAFYYPGDTWSLPRQLDWIDRQLLGRARQPVLVFLNVGETHVPYYYTGAPWSRDDNPCTPFQTADRSDECRMRQRACLEQVDALLAPLLERFAAATTVVCADHGDCWGEDGLWEHGVSHEMTLAVPLLFRLSAAVAE